MGSPPQVRGKLYNSVDSIFRYRITPAGAGKTFQILSLIIRKKDHPRRCGENGLHATTFAEVSGSPPQVRGKLFRQYKALLPYRITPAGAGKTRLGAGYG